MNKEEELCDDSVADAPAVILEGLCTFVSHFNQ